MNLVENTSHQRDHNQITNGSKMIRTAESIQICKLNDIYSLRQKTWSDGKAVAPVTLKSDNNVSQKFYDALSSSSMEMKKLWMKAQLTGEGQPPEAMGSTEDILEKVASTPGAIGFVEAAKNTGKVKVLLTIEQ